MNDVGERRSAMAQRAAQDHGTMSRATRMAWTGAGALVALSIGIGALTTIHRAQGLDLAVDTFEREFVALHQSERTVDTDGRWGGRSAAIGTALESLACAESASRGGRRRRIVRLRRG